tara:strand:+ start:823 stop:1011 length:189 start_codon:yes stop_codon:yes gene_type:complete
MKTYTITKTMISYIEAKEDKELKDLYGEGVVDEALAYPAPDKEYYVITDEKGNVVFTAGDGV